MCDVFTEENAGEKRLVLVDVLCLLTFYLFDSLLRHRVAISEFFFAQLRSLRNAIFEKNDVIISEFFS